MDIRKSFAQDVIAPSIQSKNFEQWLRVCMNYFDKTSNRT